MKVVILAGGFGTRLKEETKRKPKPMVEIGGMPLLWHIMKSYSAHGFNDFIICLGYKKECIIKYFKENFNYVQSTEPHLKFKSFEDDINVQLVDTGVNTNTGGRLKAVRNLIKDRTFLLSYGDTISDVDINKLFKLHKSMKASATLTTVQPRSDYGVLNFSEDSLRVESFLEKPIEKDKWINGGFYILQKRILDLIDGENCSFENEILPILATKKELIAYRHTGFWKSVETYKDKLLLNELWNDKVASWNVWNEQFRNVL